jgi:hypothetical protein
MDPCIYYKITSDYYVLLSTHVDNIGIFFKSLNNKIKIEIIIKELSENLPFTDEGNLHNYLNVNIEYDNKNGIMKLNQHKYIDSILNKYNINKIKHTPMLPYYQSKNNNISTSTMKNFNEMPRNIQEKVGCLRYVVDNTRSDMLFATARASTDSTGNIVERIYQYLYYSKNYVLILRKSIHGLFLHAFVDASYLQNPFMKSYYGYSIFLNNNSGAFYCVSKTITSMIPQSAMECEYYAIVECAKTLLFFYYIMKEIKTKNMDSIPTIIIYTDSESSIELANSPAYHPKSRHFNPKYHLIKDLIEKDLILLKYVTSPNNCSVTHTKTLQESPL